MIEAIGADMPPQRGAHRGPGLAAEVAQPFGQRLDDAGDLQLAIGGIGKARFARRHALHPRSPVRQALGGRREHQHAHADGIFDGGIDFGRHAIDDIAQPPHIGRQRLDGGKVVVDRLLARDIGQAAQHGGEKARQLHRVGGGGRLCMPGLGST